MKKKIEVTFWGVRGSIATHKLDRSRYGGHTACASIFDGEQYFVCDAGTGIRFLGQRLLRKKNPIALFLSHLHWDHIFGLPFFEPLYQKKRKIVLAGPQSRGLTFKKALNTIMRPPFFPIGPVEWNSHVHWMNLKPKKMKLGNVRIECRWVRHTDPTLGYKFIFSADKKIIYVSDQELKKNDPQFLKWIQGADLLIHDAQYDPKKYAKYKGWGHSSFEDVLRLAIKAKVKKLVLFHHDPDSTDPLLQRRADWCQKFLKKNRSSTKCLLAKEGLTLRI